MSHGRSGEVFCSDGEKFSNCETLRGKPKLFFSFKHAETKRTMKE